MANLEGLSVSKIKSHSGYTGSEAYVITFGSDTTDGVTHVMYQFNLNDNSVYKIRADVVARLNSTSVAKSLSGYIEAAARRLNGGVATIIGSGASSVYTEGSPSYQLGFDCSGNAFRITCVGGAGETVSWACTVRYQAVSTAA